MLLKNFKWLKEIMDLLKVLSNNPSKYDQDLISKSKQIISQIQNINIKNRNIGNKSSGKYFSMRFQIINLFEDEIAKITNKYFDKILTEFRNVLNEDLNQLIQFQNYYF